MGGRYAFCGTITLAALFLAAAAMVPTAALGQGEPATEISAGLVDEAEDAPSVEKLQDTLDSNYSRYAVFTSSAFGSRLQEGKALDALKSAVLSLSGVRLEAVATGSREGEGLQRCLQQVADNPVLSTRLADVAATGQNSGEFKEYLRTYCNGMLGTPYRKGKVPFRQMKVGKKVGDLVVEKGKVWLSGDQGFEGSSNGHVDPGEVFGVKAGLINISRGSPYLSASARMVPLDNNLQPCPQPGSEESLKAPPECRYAAVLTDRLPLPELSPGERATVGPFDVVLNPDLPGPLDLSFALLVDASGGPKSRTVLSVHVAALPELKLSSVAVDDDETGSSRGNSDGRIAPGEKIELRAKIAMWGRKSLSKIGIRARQYSSFLTVADKNLGIPHLKEGKGKLLSGDFEFDVPTVERMGEIPRGGANRQFFTERKITLWFAASGCSGKTKLDKSWATSVPDTYLCPLGAPGYTYVLNVQLPIVFGQVFLISSKPAGAEVFVNDIPMGVAKDKRPVVFTQVQPVKNSIVYYTVSARKDGYEPAELKVPVIYKDETAKTLTMQYGLELKKKEEPKVAIPALPLVEPVKKVEPTPPHVLDPIVVKKPEPPKVEEPVERPLAAFRLGGATRVYQPRFSRSSASLDTSHPPTYAGFELGAAYYFTAGLHVFLDGQVLFSLKDPAVKFQQDTGGQQIGGTTLNKLDLVVDSATVYTLCLGPAYRLDLPLVNLTGSVGLLLEGVSADTARHEFHETHSLPQLEEFSVAARPALALSVDEFSPWVPYVTGFAVVPREDFDWGVTAGLEFRLK